MAATLGDRAPGVDVECPSSPLVAVVDVAALHTALRNLLDNAVKYSLADSLPVRIAIVESAAGMVIQVEDDGPGIPEGDLADVFEPFFRVDRSRSKRTGGYGLGLSICKRVVEAHGGTITVANRPGRGATFTVVMPKREGRCGSEAAPAAAYSQ